jgi:hypothetical protein
MFDWDRMEERRQQSVASAKRSARGLPKEHLTPGALVTISPCKCTGDRSYSHDVWEIVAANEGHLCIRKINARPSDFGAEPTVICIHEHEFYGADHLLPTKATLTVVS